MKRKEDMINELKPPALQRIQDSWQLELGDVYHKHKEFIKGVEKSLAIIQHQERSYGNRGLSPVHPPDGSGAQPLQPKHRGLG